MGSMSLFGIFAVVMAIAVSLLYLKMESAQAQRRPPKKGKGAFVTKRPPKADSEQAAKRPKPQFGHRSRA